MMNGLNILPSYTAYFTLNTTTTALNSASVWLGGCLCGAYSRVPDYVGRKWALFYGAAITIVGVILQAAAQNVAMFVVARVIVGFGTGCTAITVPVYLAETLPVEHRAWGLGMVYDAWYVGEYLQPFSDKLKTMLTKIGGLLAAGITYGTAKMESTWAWRLPSLLQGLFSLLCICLLSFTPESPRWLQFQGRTEEAMVALAQTHTNGVTEDPKVQYHLREIIDNLAFEKEHKPASLRTITRDASSRKRIFLASTVGVFCMLCGNNIVSYYRKNRLLHFWNQIDIVYYQWATCSTKPASRIQQPSSKSMCASMHGVFASPSSVLFSAIYSAAKPSPSFPRWVVVS